MRAQGEPSSQANIYEETVRIINEMAHQLRSLLGKTRSYLEELSSYQSTDTIPEMELACDRFKEFMSRLPSQLGQSVTMDERYPLLTQHDQALHTQGYP